MSNYTINGMDVSRYQWDIDWHQIKTPITPLHGDILFSYVKATEGVGYIDPFAEKNAQGVKMAGLKLGYYHFATLNNSTNPAADAKSEAEAFLAAFKKLPEADLPPVLDIEANPSKLTPQQVLTYINSFFDTLKAGGVTNYIIYSYAYFLTANLPDNHGLGTVPLWIANYGKVQSPALPKGWNDYLIWQYSSSGSFKGTNGKPVPCDLNIAKDGFLSNI
jgi:lysozyme